MGPHRLFYYIPDLHTNLRSLIPLYRELSRFIFYWFDQSNPNARFSLPKLNYLKN
jgi:hypothetical protein